MIHFLILSILLPLLPAVTPPQAPFQLRLVEVRKVWDAGDHNAFTDLIRYRDSWWMTFREAEVHGVPDPGRPGGKIRVLFSQDGRSWKSAALLEAGRDQDLRDPKLSIRPQGDLMLLCAAAPTTAPQDRQPMVFLSGDGRNWQGPHLVGEPNFWLWRATWHQGQAYGVGYRRDSSGQISRLYRSSNGTDFQVLVPTLHDQSYPNEAALLFEADGRALCLLRRDGEQTKSALLGFSRSPFTDWSWKDLGVRIGGPALISLPDGSLLAGTRLYDGQVRTALSWIDPEQGRLVELLSLPSGGDTSYPGLVWHQDQLWVSYYSSHEGKTSIYLARIEVD